ncbi:type II secretion system protein N [Desulfobacula phenolica]|uniref:General secretion pathway protein C n=1 Tax=Desulfobacula phenolica TaxID=90732 RepID=A0A1H2DP63_9BACT|nr:type II secretion system protein N [Desulfobacula phenolica]SDT84606.1 general secretion pathway protein C [Desulfobacula phenolica]
MKQVFTIINLVLIFFIIDFSVSGFYTYFSTEFETSDDFKTVDVQLQPVENKKNQNQSYYNAITVRDLFKTKKNAIPEKQISSKSASAQKIRLTELKLELKGTITGNGSELFAVIKKKGEKKEELYKTDDMIDRAVIKAIFRKRVVLLVDGNEETLLMEESKPKEIFNKGPGVFSGVPAGGGRERIFDTVKLKWADVNGLANDLKNIRKHVRVRHHFYRGKMDGFRLSNIKNDSIFYEKLGLRNGDVVAGVNGEDVKSIVDFTRLYNDFKLLGKNDMVIQIKRNGVTGEIRYSLE